MKTLVGDFGIGLFSLPFYKKIGFGHPGAIDGFQTIVVYYPDEKVTIAYTSNGGVMPMNDVYNGVASIYFGVEYALP